MKLSIWLQAKSIACLLRIFSILANVEGITSRGLAPLAETNFKSNYEPTSALKGSNSNYYNQQQQKQQQEPEQQQFNNYYSNNRELKLNIVNDTPLTREEQTGFVAEANGFVPTAIIAAAGQQTINGYNSNNGNLQNMYGNNYLNYNNNNNNNKNLHQINVDVSSDDDVTDNGFIGKLKMNMKKYMKIPKHEPSFYTINNRNYVPTLTREFQYGQTANIYDGDDHSQHQDDVNDSQHYNNHNNNENYFQNHQQQQQQQQQQQLYEYLKTTAPISYLQDYHNIQQEQNADLDETTKATIASPTLPKGIYNAQTTHFVQQQQQQGGEEEVEQASVRQLQKLTLTNNEKLEYRNKRPKYYEQYHPLHAQWPPTRTIVHHNPQSEAALADIPLARHVTVTKQVPVVVEHQRILQPYNQSVPVEVPQTVINTQSRPIPIQVPVPHTIAVPEIRDLHIPIEKLHPYPVERPIPYMVERHKPYSVERQVAIPYYYPYPIRVPIVKTVVHKSPAHKHAKASAHGGGWVIKRVQHQPASLFH